MAFKAKSIDEIKGVTEMVHLMDALNISCEGLQTLDEMKSHLRVELSHKETPNWSPGQAFSVLSKAKAEDVRKRKLLMEFYTEADRFLSTMDDEMLASVQELLGNEVKEVLKQHKEQLGQSQYFCLVAGETSSGKSSLVNLILGEEILPCSLLPATSTIWEIKYGNVRKFVVHFKDKDPKTGQKTATTYLKTTTGSTGSSPQSDFGQIPRVKIEKIELFWPHPVLENGIVIVDSPGMGESEEMDDMVIKYLPKAFSFIYVIDTAARGVRIDQLEKLFEKVKKVFGVENKTEETEESEQPLELLLSKCVLFVCNKWDCVKVKEIEEVENDVTKKLKRAFPCGEPESRIIYISTEKANTAQSCGFITKGFSSLMDGMRSMITESIGYRLKLHWRWLDKLLSEIINQAKSLIENTFEALEKLKQKITRISTEKEQDKVMADLQKCLEKSEGDAVRRLSLYLSSEDVKARFASWAQEEVPEKENSLEKTAERITTALSSRFREIIKQWEDDNKVFAKVPISLLQQFQKYFDVVEDQLPDPLGAVSDDRDVADKPEKNSSWNYFNVACRFGLGVVAFAAAARFGGANNLQASLLTTAVTFADRPINYLRGLKDTRKYRQYEKDKIAFMASESKNYLTAVENEEQLKEYVQCLLKPGKLLLENIEAHLPEIIQAEKDRLPNLEDEKRSQKESKDVYQKIRDEGSQLKSNLAVFGIKDVCAIEISCKDLEKGEMFSGLGSSAFGDFYQGTTRKQGTVTLKVSREKPDVTNAGEIMKEMEILSKLKNHHIAQFYGMAFLKKEVDNVRMILVMEKCKGNLKSEIFEDLASVPGNSENPVVIANVCRWAKEITDGLVYIHGEGVVHRDLKLENILLSEENEVKIAFVGLAKPEVDITDTVAETYVNVAPEVFHSQKYGKKADIYSLGIVLWEMWYGQRAFGDRQWRRPKDLFNWVDTGHRPVDTKGCKKPPLWEHLMTQCWKGNPEERPTAEECNKEIVKLLLPKTVEKAVIG